MSIFNDPALSASIIAQSNNALISGNMVDRIGLYSNGIHIWLSNNKLELLLAVAAGILIFLILTWLKKKAAKLSKTLDNSNSLRAIFTRAVGKTNRFFRIMVAIELIVIFATTPPFLASLITFLFTIAAVWQAAIWVREIVIGMIERKADEASHNETFANALALMRILVSIAIFSIALIVTLDNLGVDVTGLIAGLGVGGIAIGLAAQGIFSDLFAALSIIFDKPFRVGDTISYDTSTATVEKIGMKSTRLRSIGGELLIISNSSLLDMEITNNTMTGYRRTQYPIGVIYQTSPEKARAIPALLQGIVEKEGGRFVRAGFTGFGDSSINFDLYFDIYSQSYQDIFATRHRIGLSIIEAFAKEGIEFAYPTQTQFMAAPDGRMIMPYKAAK